MELSAAVLIRRPPDVVFEAWARLDRAVEYGPGAIERRILGEVAVGKGARLYAIDRWPGFDVDYKITVTAFLPSERIAATLSAPLSGGWDAIFETRAEGTEMRLETTLSPGGVLGLTLPLLKPWAARRHRATLEGFRAWVEAGAEPR